MCIRDRLYIVLYVRGLGSARSTVWTLAFLLNIAILFIPR